MSDHTDTIREHEIEVFSRAWEYVPLGLYDEIQRPAEEAFGALLARCAAAEQFVEDVREWAQVAATRPDHPLLELLAEYDAGRQT